MWSCYIKPKSHYREALKEVVKDFDAYYLHVAGEVADREGRICGPLDPRDYLSYSYLFDDRFTLKISEEMPESKEPDVLFGKGNKYVCGKVDPESPDGKTIYVREADYAIPFLDMFIEGFDEKSNFEVKYQIVSIEDPGTYPAYIIFSFDFVTN
ncbi:MAG: hypothetical protein J5623_00265 [Clostridiales bacterium]|nr:hypothetical protein [Clostridiales bacterium]